MSKAPRGRNDIFFEPETESLGNWTEDKHIFISILLSGDFYDILHLLILPVVLSGYSGFPQQSKRHIRWIRNSGRPSGVSVWVNGVCPKVEWWTVLDVFLLPPSPSPNNDFWSKLQLCGAIILAKWFWNVSHEPWMHNEICNWSLTLTHMTVVVCKDMIKSWVATIAIQKVR